MQQWAQVALDVQTACNMGGVARTFADAVAFLHSVKPAGVGTEWVNQHPIVRLFGDKIVDLARVREVRDFSVAFDACEALAKGEQ